MRIVGGQWRGRAIASPKGGATRPTSDRVREAVFNVLAHRLELEAHTVYDLYAGTGAYGLEALSRGAAHATFVESDRRMASAIRQALEALKAPAQSWRVEAARVESWAQRLAQAGGGWGEAPLVFLDPPYALWGQAPPLEPLGGWLGWPQGSVVVAETSSRTQLEPSHGLELWETKSYGDIKVFFFRRI